MSDEELRAAERRFRATGAHVDEVAWLMARLRRDAIAPARLHAAARLGHPPAMELLGVAADPVPAAGDLGMEWEDWVEPPEYGWWDPRGWFQAPLVLPSARVGTHVGEWVRGCVHGLDDPAREEVALLHAAGGLLGGASGHEADIVALMDAARSLDRWQHDPTKVVLPLPPAPTMVAGLLGFAEEAVAHHVTIRRELRAADRPAALEAATRLEIVRRRLSNAVRDATARPRAPSGRSGSRAAASAPRASRA